MTKDMDVSARKQIKLAFMLSYHLPLTSANYPVKGKTHEDQSHETATCSEEMVDCKGIRQ